MPESKSWQNKTDIKHVKETEIVGFIKTSGQYSHKLTFGHIFSSTV